MKVIQGYVHKVPKNSRTVENSGSIQGSGKLPTYPSPNPAFCSKWGANVNVESGGVGGQFPRNLNWSKTRAFTLIYLDQFVWETAYLPLP